MTADNFIQAVSTLGAAGIAAAVTYIVGKMQHKGKPENALIDQLQEQINGLKDDVKGLKAEQQATKRREHLMANYVHQLRQDIIDQRPPPPRDWPEGLYP